MSGLARWRATDAGGRSASIEGNQRIQSSEIEETSTLRWCKCAVTRGMNRSKNDRSTCTDDPAKGHCFRGVCFINIFKISVSATSNGTAEGLNTSSTRPDFVCVDRHHSSMVAMATGNCEITRVHSATTFNSASVTTQDASNSTSRDTSKPVISQSSQINAFCCALENFVTRRVVMA